jgi:WD40 repeat protein
LKWGHTIQVWKLGDTVTKVSEFPYSSNVTNFTYNPIMVSPDSRYVLVGDLDGATHLMDTTTGEELQTFKAKNTAMSVAFSPDGNTILISSQDQFVRLYDRQTGDELRSIPLTDWAWVAAFTPDGKYVLTGSDRGSVRLWEVQFHPHLPVITGHTDVVFAASFSPDGQLLATGGADGLRLWQSSSSRLVRNFPEAGSLAGGTEFSANGRHLLSGNITGVATLWNVKTGQAERQFIHPSSFQIYDVAFSPDDRSILTAGVGPGTGEDMPETVWVWDLQQTAEPKLKINTEGHPIFQAVFSPDGKYILGAVGNEPVARMWDAKTGALVREFTGHTDSVMGVSFSPDGKTIATASNDNTARLWNTQTGQEIRQFLGHIEAIWGVAFSPDGKILATASADGTARLWDVQTGEELRRLAAHTAGVENVAFSPDGKFIVTVSDDGTTRLWDVNYHDTIRYLCSRLLRDFTDEERAEYGIPDDKPTCSGE